MVKTKQLINWLPIVAIAALGFFSLRQWQPAAMLNGRPQSAAYQVVKVSDGDTITVRADGKEDKIRFCGIDAPEVRHGDQPGQPFGEESREKLRSLISAAGNQVIVYPAERDRYGRLVAEVFVSAGKGTEEENLLNYEMVRSGMAYHYAKYSDRCPNGKDFLVRAEQEAQAKRLGVWSGSYQKPWEFRKAQR
jgi:endonuclease YncB( thermonuclease family)